MSQIKYLDTEGLAFLWAKIKARFVDKDGDKGLSDNNYTDEDKAKVATVSAISSAMIDQIFDS